jgi:HEPN domain-containing protein
MRKNTENFIKSAAYDIETAAHMLKTGRYIYVVFTCHLSMEKMLKAVIAEALDIVPPRTHNLLYLTKLAGVSFSEDHFDFIAKINNASVVTRYPEDFVSLKESFPEEVVSVYLNKTREIIEWLKQHEKLKRS